MPGGHETDYYSSSNTAQRPVVYMHRNGEAAHELLHFTARMRDLHRATVRHDLLTAADAALDLPTGSKAYDAYGRRLSPLWTPREEEHIYFVPPGAPFIWPGVRIGHVVNVSTDDSHLHRMETLSMTPRLFYLHGLFSGTECKVLRAAARAQYVASESMDPQTGHIQGTNDRPNSWTAWVGRHFSYKDPRVYTNSAVETLQRRAADAARVHIGHAEPFQMVQYNVGGYNSYHRDGYFHPELGYSRAVTVLAYLSTLEQTVDGGGTNFPYANRSCAASKLNMYMYTNPDTPLSKFVIMPNNHFRTRCALRSVLV